MMANKITTYTNVANNSTDVVEVRLLYCKLGFEDFIYIFVVRYIKGKVIESTIPHCC